jgi:hypothetical protein
MRVLFYNDRTLNEVINYVMEFGRDSVFEALNSWLLDLGKRFRIGNFVIDQRFLIAGGIIFSMAHNCHPYGKRCILSDIQPQIAKIVEAIAPSLRWRAFSKGFEAWINQFDVKKAGRADFERLNQFEELFLGIVSFSNMEMREKKRVERCFKSYIEDLGLVDYEQFLQVFSYLADIEDRLGIESKLYGEKTVAELEHSFGLKKGVLTLGEERLNDLNLADLHRMIIPIFFAGRPGIRIGFFRLPMSDLNLPQRLCFALDEPREEIIEGAYKGSIFEDFICDLLRGELVVAIKPEDPLKGYVQRSDYLQNLSGGKELLNALEKNTSLLAWERIAGGYEYYISEPKISKGEEHTIMSYTYFRYNYCLPPGQTKCQIVIKEDAHASFAEFLNEENVTEWEEDLLLLHKNKPKHCLVAQAKFTKKYAHKKYCAARDHVMKFANYVERNGSAKSELGIPTDMPVLPVLFTSFSGAVFKDQDKVLKTTIYPLLRGHFLNLIENHMNAIV